MVPGIIPHTDSFYMVPSINTSNDNEMTNNKWLTTKHQATNNEQQATSDKMTKWQMTTNKQEVTINQCCCKSSTGWKAGSVTNSIATVHSESNNHMNDARKTSWQWQRDMQCARMTTSMHFTDDLIAKQCRQKNRGRRGDNRHNAMQRQRLCSCYCIANGVMAMAIWQFQFGNSRGKILMDG